MIYFTATFPYFVIFAFLVRSLTLDGAEVGVRYLFKPKWELLADAKVITRSANKSLSHLIAFFSNRETFYFQVWVNAAGQVFNSVGLAFGSIISFASYNKKNNKILIDTVSVSLINAVTSLSVAVFAFATIGNIAAEHHTSVHDVITDGN